MDPWNSVKSVASTFALGTDTNFAQILAAKKALSVLSDNSDLLVKVCLAAADGDNLVVKDVLSKDSHILNAYDKSGLTPLVYAVCFNKEEIVELLINFNVDCNEPDRLFTWTPIMWATYLDLKPIVTLLLNNDADPYLKSAKSGKNAVDLVVPGSEMYEYFVDHNVIKLASIEPLTNGSSSPDDSFHGSRSYGEDPELAAKIKMQTAGVSTLNVKDTSEDAIYKSATFGFPEDVLTSSSFSEPFDYEKVLQKQSIQFHDANLTSLLDYIFSLYDKYQHKTTLPATIVFQCLRYAHSTAESKHLCETLLDLFLTRVRSTTNTKSGVPSMTNAQGDIVMLSYWLSVINFLYYYLYRDHACDFFKNYPKFLQEIVNTKQTLIAQLSFSINNRLDPLIDSCILDYVNLPDSKNVIFQKEWHFFKKRYLSSKTTYDEILDMLYPPPPAEQMKPSPIRVTQTLGALVYVLNLHQVNDLIKQQTLSAVLYWIGASVFDRVVANKSYQSRTRAIQIRLNLSVVEDWLRSNDFKADIGDEFLACDRTFPDKLTVVKLTNAARFADNINDPRDVKFYHNTLFKIGKHHLMPAVELLQWLQVMTSLKDEESLQHTLSNFIMLIAPQILKAVKGYRYELGEAKFPKELTLRLKQIVETKKYNVPPNLFFVASEKQDNILLNPDVVFPVVLANMQQLLVKYGGEVSGHNDLYSRQFAPFLPIEIVDAVDEIYDQSLSGNAHGDDRYDDSDGDDDENGTDAGASRPTDASKDEQFKGDELFKTVQVPSSLAHKTWGEIEENPW